MEWNLQASALKALHRGRISRSPSTDFDMFRVDAHTGAPIDDGVDPVHVSNGPGDSFITEQRNAGVQNDFHMAAYYFKLSADRGDAVAQLDYGECLRKGEGVERNYEMAAYYAKLSADQGDAGGQCSYGNCLRKGEGVPRNSEMAAYYFKLSADQRYAGGQLHYGFCLWRGEGVPRNSETAAYYFKLSADQGDAGGQCNYGFCLHIGAQSNNDVALAVSFYKLAADQGSAHGQYNYGFCLEYGDGIGQDLKIAAQYYKQAADQGDPYGQCYYGLCLEYGKGVDKDLKMAAFYYKLAADENDSDKYRLCRLHLFFFDLTKFSVGSPQYIKFSTAHAKATAQLCLGHLLEEGIGINADHIFAAKYYEMAAELFPSACACYGWCLQHGRSVPISLKEVVVFFQYAADGDNADGANSLGICLEYGLGIDKILTDQFCIIEKLHHSNIRQG
jgi:TPR repeat protein